MGEAEHRYQALGLDWETDLGMKKNACLMRLSSESN
jgi:hypothetical protein